MTATRSGGLIFISCGLVTCEERILGSDICGLVRELTPHEPYFAQNENSLAGLTTNILGALYKAVGLIAVMHPRGIVKLPDNNEQIRASVWIEQEIAIAAFMTQVLGRRLEIAHYSHADVKREGMREQLQLNVPPFRENDEILQHLRELLPSWKNLRPFVEVDDGLVEERRNSLPALISGLNSSQREVLKLLLIYGSLTDYNALKKLQALGLGENFASVLPGLQNITGLVRPVPGQPNPRQSEYELNWELKPEWRELIAHYFYALKKTA